MARHRRARQQTKAGEFTMFMPQAQRRDFADTRVLEPAIAGAPGFGEAADAGDAFEQANAADQALLRLVACAAGATLVLALVTSLR
jgi:hypothetical protein